MKFIKKSIVILLTVIIISTNVFAAEDGGNTSEQYAQEFKEIMDLILNNYLDDSITAQKLFEAAIEGMFGSLDKYSEFFTEKEMEAFTRNMEKSYVGIGVELKEGNNYVEINKVFKGGAAEKGGVRAGDVIKSINGESAIEFTPAEVADRVLGEEGTEVVITFERNETEYTLTLIRAIINLTTVEQEDISNIYKDLDKEVANEIGYLSITSFSQNTDKEFTSAVNDLKEKDIKYLILDLRDNGGGYVNQAVNVSNEIVPAGPVLHFINKEGRKITYSSYQENPPFEIVALINENSASATEFVAAAIKESGIGVLVGENTYGKGVAQYMYSLSTEYMLKLTVEEFRSRNNNVIHEKGVNPDYKVAIPRLINSDKRFYLNDDLEQIYNVESILAYLGYKISNPDTKYDRESYNAVYKFQKDNGLYPYGVCDYSTQKKLNDIYLKSISEKDIQRDKALEIILGKINEK